METKKSDIPQDGRTYVRNADGTFTPLNEYPDQGGSYVKNSDGSLTKIEENHTQPAPDQELSDDQ
jgi:hypothetical protein